MKFELDEKERKEFIEWNIESQKWWKEHLKNLISIEISTKYCIPFIGDNKK